MERPVALPDHGRLSVDAVPLLFRRLLLVALRLRLLRDVLLRFRVCRIVGLLSQDREGKRECAGDRSAEAAKGWSVNEELTHGVLPQGRPGAQAHSIARSFGGPNNVTSPRRQARYDRQIRQLRQARRPMECGALG